jgi:hypothetical protein
VDIRGLNITTGLEARAATTQQSYVATPPAQKNRQTAVFTATDQYRSTSESIIDAEYVDLYSPVRHPPEQQNQWRNLIVEEKKIPSTRSDESEADKRHQQLIARYGQNSNDFPLPGSFVNLLV